MQGRPGGVNSCAVLRAGCRPATRWACRDGGAAPSRQPLDCCRAGERRAPVARVRRHACAISLPPPGLLTRAARRPAEHFVYDGAEHVCVAAPHVLHVFSFSKAFGMMGWRAPASTACAAGALPKAGAGAGGTACPPVPAAARPLRRPHAHPVLRHWSRHLGRFSRVPALPGLDIGRGGGLPSVKPARCATSRTLAPRQCHAQAYLMPQAASSSPLSCTPRRAPDGGAATRRRVGYIAYQGAALGAQLLKVQDTIPICPPQLSQHLALGAVAAGRPWVAERVAAIAGNRRAAAGPL